MMPKRQERAGYLLLAGFCLLMWWVTWGATLAEFQRNPVFGRPENCRHDLGFAVGWSLLPPAWVLWPFTTGFAEYGFQWTCDGKP